jgi:hypothetical protein
LISCVDEDKRNYINNQIIANLLKLVLDANGICIAKSFIAGNFSLDIRKRTLEAIIVNCLEILQNPFGNYVIQEVFEVKFYFIVRNGDLRLVKKLLRSSIKILSHSQCKNTRRML